MNESESNGWRSWRGTSEMVGEIPVLRLLPRREAEAIGPFVFLDHFGPIPAPRGKLPAHPHAGIEVMTYLLDGANEHTDSLGNVGRIAAGGAQWMRAGRGILHTERNLVDEASTMHGLQIWARLPVAEQGSAPEYRAIAAGEVPRWSRDGGELRLLAGQLEGHEGPIPLASPSVLAHLSVPAGAALDVALPAPAHEHAVYVIEADADAVLDGSVAAVPGTMASAPTGADSIRIEGRAEVLLLGGEPAPRPLLFGGPFVFDSQAALLDAQRRYATGGMGTLDGVPF